MKPEIWLFHLVVLLTTAKKWTKVKNARAGRAKLLFLFTKYANSWRSCCRRRCRFLTYYLLGVPHWWVKSSGVRQSKILSMAGLGWFRGHFFNEWLSSLITLFSQSRSQGFSPPYSRRRKPWERGWLCSPTRIVGFFPSIHEYPRVTISQKSPIAQW